MSFWRKLSPFLRHALTGGLLLVLILGVALWFTFREILTAEWQAKKLAKLGTELTFRLEPGKAKPLPAPAGGPYDERLGYDQMAAFSSRLAQRGFTVAEEARPSDRLVQLTHLGLFPAYHEKDQGGLSLADCRGQSIYSTRYPERIYENFESIPPVLVDTLLFIENRELLDTHHPTRNPAVEWDRFAKAAADQLVHFFNPNHEAPGGSTLATQIEKYRHSPEGRTKTGKEKLRQMASASVRAYLDGEDTTATRRRIVVTYLNTVPLSAKPGFGEVNGLGDGLWAWYGRDFGEVNRLLGAPANGAAEAGSEDLLGVLAEGLGAGGVYTAKASRGESSFRGKGSAPGCIPKLVLPRPDRKSVV